MNNYYTIYFPKSCELKNLKLLFKIILKLYGLCHLFSVCFYMVLRYVKLKAVVGL